MIQTTLPMIERERPRLGGKVATKAISAINAVKARNFARNDPIRVYCRWINLKRSSITTGD